jgi:mannose-1-phosphate guanylyltransferase / mannose-6-phosphate isomerase
MTATSVAEWGERLRPWLFDQALPLWQGVGVDRASGAFEEAIGWDGRATNSPRRARVQARQVYVFSVAGALGWDGPWRETIEGGLRYIAEAFRRADGLCRTRVARDGSVLDDTAVLYDQAFFLFAGAAAAAAFPERRDALQESALDHLARVEAHFRNPAGGFREASEEQPFQSNPHMHLFEASMAWSELTGHARWTGLADRIAELCLSRFIDGRSGALREFFDAAWRPAAGPAGRIVEPGHQFEWAWLLARWGLARGHAGAQAAARRLFEIGASHGVDPVRGVAFNQLDDAFAPLDTVARLWPQTERVKAALKLGDHEEAAQGCAGLWRYLDVTPMGLWRDRLKPDGGFIEEPAPASSFYHIICAVSELLAAQDA